VKQNKSGFAEFIVLGVVAVALGVGVLALLASQLGKPQGKTLAVTSGIQSVIDIYAAGKGSSTMELRVNDQAVQTYTSVGGNFADRQAVKYTYTHSSLVTGEQVKIAFTNDSATNDLYVDKVVIDGVVYESESSYTYSTGVYTQGKCQSQGGYFRNDVLSCSGYFKYSNDGGVGTPSYSSTIDIYAAGASSPTMVLSINDTNVSTYQGVGGSYSNRQFIKYTYVYQGLLTGEQVKVMFTNDAAGRDLWVDKIVINGIAYETESSSTYSTGVYTSGKCQSQGGYFKNEKLSCNGYFRYGAASATPASTATPTATPTPTPASVGTGLMGTYSQYQGTAVYGSRVDPTINFTWSQGSPMTGVPDDNFMVSWRGQLQVPQTGQYAFTIGADDGIKLWIDGNVVADGWYDHSYQEFTSSALSLSAGKHDIRLDFYEAGWDATAKLMWAGGPITTQAVIAAQYLFPAEGSAVVTPPPSPTPTPTPVPPSTAPSSNTLSGYGNLRNIKMGAAVKWSAVVAGEQDYINTLTREYNYVVAENEFKPKSISIKEGTIKFEIPDAFMAWAESKNMSIGAHTLVWHHNVPTWLETGGFSNSYVETWLENYIKTVVGRYKGRIDHWDVVNEPIKFSSPYTSASINTGSFWYQKIGPTVFEKAFRWAHEADPNAKLFVNEYSTEWDNAKTTALYNLVVDLKNKGVPIHGVGFQVHPNVIALPTYDQIYTSMKKFNDLGLDLAITEMDIAIPLPVNDTMLNQQAKTYGDVVRACRALPRCKEYTTWGFTDKYSWINSPNYAGGNSGAGHGWALPFDANYNKKPAYNAIIDALK